MNTTHARAGRTTTGVVRSAHGRAFAALIAGTAMAAAVIIPAAGAPAGATATTPTKIAYLTFDDGPGPATRSVLKILKKHGATATFFQIGKQVAGDPGATKLIKAQGSNVGNHTYDHADLTRLSDGAIRREVAGGPAGRCVRPPYGAVNPRVRGVLKDMGKRVVLWTADTRDWARPGLPAILRGAELNLHDRSIILMHDGGGDRAQTIAALPALLDDLRARGYRVSALPYC